MLNAAIIGLGNWGRHLVESVQGRSGKLRFSDAFTLAPAEAADFARRNDLRLCADLKSLIDAPDIGAIVIATPHSLHLDHVTMVAASGRPVFVEKPLALNGRDAARAAAICAEAGVGLVVGYNWRFQPAVRKLLEVVAAGTIGRVVHLEGNYSGPSAYRRTFGSWRTERAENPAGGMTGRGLHVIDVMNALCGPVVSVYARSDRHAADHDVDDTTSALIRFANGTTATVGACQVTAEYWRVHAFGTSGWAEMRNEGELTIAPLDGPTTTLRFAPVSPEFAELEAFADAVAANNFPASPIRDAINGAATLEAIDLSARCGRPVSVPVDESRGDAVAASIPATGTSAETVERH